MKICTACNIKLPKDSFYSKKEGGVTSKCKKCTCQSNKLKRSENKIPSENDILAENSLKRCSACLCVKHTDDFYKKRDSFEGFCKKCKDNKRKVLQNTDPTFRQRSQLVRKEYFKNNPDAYAKRLEYSRAYYQLNKKNHNNSVRSWHKRNPGKSSEYFRKWRLANLDVSAYHAQKRRAAKLRATPTWATCEETEIKEIYKKCAEMTATGMKYNVDHIVPLQSDFVCGLHCLANLQIITATENSAKNNFFWPDMW